MQDEKTTQQPLSCSMETAAATIAERCFQDKAFGEKFLADPKTALAEQEIKMGHRDVHVHENDARNWHIVLPNIKAREALSKYTAEELKAMKDVDMRNLSGGEVAVSAIILGGTVAIGSTVAIAGGAIGTHYGTKKKK